MQIYAIKILYSDGERTRDILRWCPSCRIIAPSFISIASPVSKKRSLYSLHLYNRSKPFGKL